MSDDPNQSVSAGSDAEEGASSCSGKGRGRPRKLEPDVRTLGQIEGMAAMFAPLEDMAAVLGVDKKTLIDFKARHREVQRAWKRGWALRQVSLKRQMRRSKDPRILIYLGRKYLGQKG